MQKTPKKRSFKRFLWLLILLPWQGWWLYFYPMGPGIPRLIGPGCGLYPTNEEQIRSFWGAPRNMLERVEIWWEINLEPWLHNLEYVFAHEPLKMILMVLVFPVMVYLLITCGTRIVKQLAARIKNVKKRRAEG